VENGRGWFRAGWLGVVSAVQLTHGAAEHVSLERFRRQLWRGTCKSFCFGGLVVKRGLDIVLAAMLLACVLPVLVVAALLIQLDSGGPVLFRQERMGRNFKRFRLIKLRTMKESTGGLAYTLGADPRITRVGRWLRWFKMDELPQLWNVLRGDMSMVGPRPVVPELAIEFRKFYETLLVARPGLTDPATVKYCREAELLGVVPEPLRYFKSVVTPDKLRISESYLRNANGWRDLCVMAATAKALFWSIRHIKPIKPMVPLIVKHDLTPVLVFKKSVPRAVREPETGKVGIASAGFDATAGDGSMVRAGTEAGRGSFDSANLPLVVLDHVGRKPVADVGDRRLSVP
jgi:lipopolysaccharide/colanic/teichoic acid biosynthesis glycosyltransferase